MPEQTIFLDTIPSGLRKPGHYFEYNSKLAVRGLPQNAKKVCIIGQKTVSGSIAEGVPTKVFSESDAILYSGNGSMVHRMVKSAYAAFPYLDLSIVNLSDHASGVAATGTFTISGPATSAGVLRVFVGKDKVEIPIASGDVQNSIAAALNTAIGLRPDLPVTAGVSTNVVTLTAKNKGTIANQILLAKEITAAGVSAVVVAMASGATNPELNTALAAIFSGAYDIIVSPYNNLTNLTTLATYSGSDVEKLKTHVATVSNGIEQRRSCAVFAQSQALALTTTLAASANFERFMFVYLRGIKTWSAELAAAAAATWASMSDPAMPLDYKAVLGIDAPGIADRFSRAEQETLLAGGVTPLEVGAGETPQFVRAVSTYLVNSSSTPDVAYLDVTTITSLDYGDKAIRTRLALRFKPAKKTARVKKDVRSEILAVMKDLEAAEIWREIDAHKDELIIEENLQDPTGWIISIPAPVVPGAHVIAGQLVLHLSSAI